MIPYICRDDRCNKKKKKIHMHEQKWRTFYFPSSFSTRVLKLGEKLQAPLHDNQDYYLIHEKQTPFSVKRYFQNCWTE